MCGIAGAVFWNDTPDGVDPQTVVRRMTSALAHRGPDGDGVTVCDSGDSRGQAPRCVLGHRRLAIIDLSERGAQPMKSEATRLWGTYNGEIYNFRQVRNELERIGRRFSSGSDTEVLLQGYEEWGIRVVDRLRGMFAFGLWDGELDKLLLVRDRLGIKPLYVHRTVRYLLFASEIRALLVVRTHPAAARPRGPGSVPGVSGRAAAANPGQRNRVAAAGDDALGRRDTATSSAVRTGTC